MNNERLNGAIESILNNSDVNKKDLCDKTIELLIKLKIFNGDKYVLSDMIIKGLLETVSKFTNNPNICINACKIFQTNLNDEEGKIINNNKQILFYYLFF